MNSIHTIFAFLICSFLLITPSSAQTKKYPNIKGKVVKEIPYQDKTGKNVIVITETGAFINPNIQRESEWEDIGYDMEIFAYRFNLDQRNAQGQIKREWQVYDYIHDCVFDSVLEFHKEHIQITDLNHNGIKEIWLPYTITCTSDFSPIPRNIIMYEGRQKYALRGFSKIKSGGEDWCYDGKPYKEEYAHTCVKDGYMGGNYQMDKALSENPAFRAFAQSLWDKVKSIVTYGDND